MAATVDFWGVLYTTAQRGFDADGSAFFLLSTTNISNLTNILHLLELIVSTICFLARGLPSPVALAGLPARMREHLITAAPTPLHHTTVRAPTKLQIESDIALKGMVIKCKINRNI
jgi:hypothetical protein